MTSQIGSILIRSKKGYREGFTLLEMIAVLAMLAAVVAISAPSLSQFFKTRTAIEEARRFLALTEFARREAISIGVPIQILIDNNFKTISVQREDGYRTEKNTLPGPFEIDQSIVFDFEELPPRYAQTYVFTFLADGTLFETSPTMLRIYREGQRDSDDNYYQIAQLSGTQQFRLLTPDDLNNQFIQMPVQQAQPEGIYLR